MGRYLHTTVVVLLAVSAELQLWSHPDAWKPTAAVHALVAAITLPLLFCRSQPLIVAIVVSGASWLQYELGGALFQPWFAALLALYAAAAHAPLVPAIAGGCAMGVSVLAIDLPKLTRGDPVGEVVPAWFFLAGVWGLGRWMRRRQRETHLVVERAEELERERERQAQLAVAEERVRIARELHDLVAHSMGVIVIQSQGAQRSFERDSEATRRALKSIDATGRQGMAELHRLLAILTSVEGNGERSPQPGLDRLDELLDGIRAAGLRLEACVDGHVRPVARRDRARPLPHHPRGAHQYPQARRRDQGRDHPELRGRPHLGDRRGRRPGRHASDWWGSRLVGMRERVSIYGGTLDAGPRPDGGFGVHAVLPVEAPVE